MRSLSSILMVLALLNLLALTVPTFRHFKTCQNQTISNEHLGLSCWERIVLSLYWLQLKSSSLEAPLLVDQFMAVSMTLSMASSRYLAKLSSLEIPCCTVCTVAHLTVPNLRQLLELSFPGFLRRISLNSCFFARQP